MRLLNLPEGVQAYIRQGKLSAGHARALITAENPEELARQIVARGLSVREAERLAGDHAVRPRTSGVKKEKDIDTLALEAELSNTLGMKVSIDMRGKGAGNLKIDFRSLDQLDDILQRLSRLKQ
jgi:ParB family chromosome partitioning protein